MHSDILTSHNKHNGARQLIQLCCKNPSQHHTLARGKRRGHAGPNVHNATRRDPSVPEHGDERLGTPLERARVGPREGNGEPENPRPMRSPGRDARAEGGTRSRKDAWSSGSLGGAFEEESPGSPPPPLVPCYPSCRSPISVYASSLTRVLA